MPDPITKPKIPKLSSLTGAPAPEVPKVDPPPTPPAPAPKAEDTPPPAAAGDMPDIPTHVIGAEKPNTKAIIEQRRLAKEARQEAAGAVGEAESFKTQLVTTQAERDALKAERDRLEQERKDFEALANTRQADLEKFRGTYAENQRPSFDPAQDETFQTAHQQMMGALKSHMPTRIKTAAGDQRVFFDALASQPGKMAGLHTVLDSYAKAEQMGNEENMDLAVNAFAQWLGADVNISGDKQEWKTLDRSDPAFGQIEQALQRAAPHYQQKAERYQAVQRDAPVLARKQFAERQTKIQEVLSQSVFLPKDEASKMLRANPNDSRALFSLIIDEIPELKAHAQATLAGYSETFATVNDNLYLPTLKSNAPADVEAHRAEVMAHKGRLSEVMRNAVIGANIGPILSTLMAERDAAEERAAKASENTNPGDTSRAGGQGNGAGGPLPSIPTTIIGAGK